MVSSDNKQGEEKMIAKILLLIGKALFPLKVTVHAVPLPETPTVLEVK